MRGAGLVAIARAAALGAAALAACHASAPPLASCADDLGGVWRVPDATTPSGEPRAYHAVDVRGALELYPMFDDSVIAAGDRKVTDADAVIAAPAVFDLTRSGDGRALVGTQTRRWNRGAAACVMHTPARVTACAGDAMTLEATPPGPPSDWARCAPGAAPPATWQLVRERP